MLIIFLICILIPITTRGTTGFAPEITDNNPNYIEEFVNPITLNWTVLDDNLRSHKIYSNGDLIHIKQYNQTGLGQIEITLQFTLGNGRYNFTLEVIDGDNHKITDQSSILKGEEVVDLPELRFDNLVAAVILLPVIAIITNKTTRKQLCIT